MALQVSTQGARLCPSEKLGDAMWSHAGIGLLIPNGQNRAAIIGRRACQVRAGGSLTHWNFKSIWASIVVMIDVAAWPTPVSVRKAPRCSFILLTRYDNCGPRQPFQSHLAVLFSWQLQPRSQEENTDAGSTTL